MGHEQIEQPQHQGEAYLRLLGFEHLADRDVTTSAGATIKARDFLEICGNHALDPLIGFAAMSPDHPQYDAFRKILRKRIGAYVGEDVTD